MLTEAEMKIVHICTLSIGQTHHSFMTVIPYLLQVIKDTRVVETVNSCSFNILFSWHVTSDNTNDEIIKILNYLRNKHLNIYIFTKEHIPNFL